MKAMILPCCILRFSLRPYWR